MCAAARAAMFSIVPHKLRGCALHHRQSVLSTIAGV
jgi:hypothetical protein